MWREKGWGGGRRARKILYWQANGRTTTYGFASQNVKYRLVGARQIYNCLSNLHSSSSLVPRTVSLTDDELLVSVNV